MCCNIMFFYKGKKEKCLLLICSSIDEEILADLKKGKIVCVKIITFQFLLVCTSSERDEFINRYVFTQLQV